MNKKSKRHLVYQLCFNRLIRIPHKKNGGMEMIITKKVRKNVKIRHLTDTAYGLKFKWRAFRSKGEAMGLNTRQFKDCACCNEEFGDNDEVMMVEVVGKDNRLAHTKCLYGEDDAR